MYVLAKNKITFNKERKTKGFYINILSSILRTINLKEIRLHLNRRCSLCNSPLILQLGRNIEKIRCLNCMATPIHMGMGIVLKQLTQDINSKRIYELSAHGAFFNFLKRNISELTFSEYFDNNESFDKNNKIQHQDIHNLTFADKSFDIVSSTALFEHVADDMKAFSEIKRVLRPSGFMIHSMPISDLQNTVERARMKNGKIVYLKEPKYHDDIVLRDLDSCLVYRDFGMDIKERIESIGFINVRILDFNKLGLGINFDPQSTSGEVPRIVVAQKAS